MQPRNTFPLQFPRAGGSGRPGTPPALERGVEGGAGAAAAGRWIPGDFGVVVPLLTRALPLPSPQSRDAAGNWLLCEGSAPAAAPGEIQEENHGAQMSPRPGRFPMEPLSPQALLQCQDKAGAAPFSLGTTHRARDGQSCAGTDIPGLCRGNPCPGKGSISRGTIPTHPQPVPPQGGIWEPGLCQSWEQVKMSPWDGAPGVPQKRQESERQTLHPSDGDEVSQPPCSSGTAGTVWQQ